MPAIMNALQRLLRPSWTTMSFAMILSAAGDLARAAGEVKLPQLDIQSYASQIFWLIISFFVLYFLVAKVTVPRISEVMEERQERIADDLDKAESLKKEAEQVEAEYEKSQRDALDKGNAIKRAAQEDAAANRDQAEAAERERVANMLQDAEARIAAASAEAVGNIRSVAGGVVGDAVAKLAGLKVADDRIDQAIDEAMAERSRS